MFGWGHVTEDGNSSSQCCCTASWQPPFHFTHPCSASWLSHPNYYLLGFSAALAPKFNPLWLIIWVSGLRFFSGKVRFRGGASAPSPPAGEFIRPKRPRDPFLSPFRRPKSMDMTVDSARRGGQKGGPESPFRRPKSMDMTVYSGRRGVKKAPPGDLPVN